MLDQSPCVLSDASECQVPGIPIRNFLDQLALVLPKLIELVLAPSLRSHEVWGMAIPYAEPGYGSGVSRGHCVRPDIILTSDGPKICEFDFVPSGRGYLLAGLGTSQRAKVLDVFAAWYAAMGVRRVLYATATTTVCALETRLFSEALRRYAGLDIRACNIDMTDDESLTDAFVDRLSYRSEMSMAEERRSLTGCDVATAEPFLDSKAILAMVHDHSLTQLLTTTLGAEGLAFLRSAIPETRLVSKSLSEKQLVGLGELRDQWVIKNTDVETDYSWGCRGTIVGASVGKGAFIAALARTADPNRKSAGAWPILQRWHSSRDFWQTWNAIIDGTYQRTRLIQSGTEHDPKTFKHAMREVNARIGFYFLVVRSTGEVFVSPYGDLVLRQDRLVHGARDSICLPVGAY